MVAASFPISERQMLIINYLRAEAVFLGERVYVPYEDKSEQYTTFAAEPIGVTRAKPEDQPIPTETFQKIFDLSVERAERIVLTFFDNYAPDSYGVPYHAYRNAFGFTETVQKPDPRQSFLAVCLGTQLVFPIVDTDIGKPDAKPDEVAHQYLTQFYTAVTVSAPHSSIGYEL